MALGELYQPKGLALETAKTVLQVQYPYALNVGMGCTNLCKYCYGSLAFKKPDWGDLKVAPKENIAKLPKHIEKHDPKGVFLSFTTDPYIEPNLGNTLNVITVLSKQQIKYATLTKVVGITVANQDLHYEGKTIVSLERGFWKEWEPNAGNPVTRLEAIKKARHGWISVEPFPPPAIYKQDPQEFFMELANARPELIIFGKWNYDKRANTPEARRFYADAVKLLNTICVEENIRLHVKSETVAFIEKGQMKAKRNEGKALL